MFCSLVFFKSVPASLKWFEILFILRFVYLFDLKVHFRETFTKFGSTGSFTTENYWSLVNVMKDWKWSHLEQKALIALILDESPTVSRAQCNLQIQERILTLLKMGQSYQMATHFLSRILEISSKSYIAGFFRIIVPLKLDWNWIESGVKTITRTGLQWNESGQNLSQSLT